MKLKTAGYYLPKAVAFAVGIATLAVPYNTAAEELTNEQLVDRSGKIVERGVSVDDVVSLAKRFARPNLEKFSSYKTFIIGKIRTFDYDKNGVISAEEYRTALRGACHRQREYTLQRCTKPEWCERVYGSNLRKQRQAYNHAADQCRYLELDSKSCLKRLDKKMDLKSEQLKAERDACIKEKRSEYRKCEEEAKRVHRECRGWKR